MITNTEEHESIALQEYTRRRAILRENLAENGFEAIVVVGTENEPGPLRYLTGYTPLFEPSVLIVNKNASDILITGPESSRRALLHAEIEKQIPAIEFANSANPIIHGRGTSLFRILTDLRLHDTIGVVGLRFAPAILIDTIRQITSVSIISPADELLSNQRMIKSNKEIKLLRHSYTIAENAIVRTIKSVRPGISERAIESRIVQEIMRGGAHGLGYPIWCASGPNTSCPISHSTDRIVQSGDLVQLTASAEFHGYCSGVALVLQVGQCSQAIMDLCEAGHSLRETTFCEMKPGNFTDDVARTFRMRAEDLAVSGSLVHGPAHSVGCTECEWPFVQEETQVRIQSGMVFNIDIWLSQGDIGLRYEDGILIEDNGPTWLSQVSHMSSDNFISESE